MLRQVPHGNRYSPPFIFQGLRYVQSFNSAEASPKIRADIIQFFSYMKHLSHKHYLIDSFGVTCQFGHSAICLQLLRDPVNRNEKEPMTIFVILHHVTRGQKVLNLNILKTFQKLTLATNLDFCLCSTCACVQFMDMCGIFTDRELAHINHNQINLRRKLVQRDKLIYHIIHQGFNSSAVEGTKNFCVSASVYVGYGCV